MLEVWISALAVGISKWVQKRWYESIQEFINGCTRMKPLEAKRISMIY
jgi:hypothetical protein